MQRNQVLSEREKSINSEIFDSLVDVIRVSHPEVKNLDVVSVQPIKDQILKFATDQKITLNNLLPLEEVLLGEIILEAIPTKTINPSRLDNWKDGLKQALLGQGNAMYLAQSTGMAHDLGTKGYIPASKWGTDLDVIQCLGNDLTDPRTVKTAGTYILAPISLTESDEPLRLALAETLNSLKTVPGDAKVSLRIPANCGNNHWRLVKVEIQNKTIQSATLWDSLPGDPDALMNRVFFTNMQSAVAKVSVNNQRANLSVICAGVQRDGYTCMDRTLQEAYRGRADNDIIKAGNEGLSLRLAVLKQIASNYEPLNPIAKLINEEYIEGAVAAAKKTASKPATQKSVLDKNTFLNYLNWGQSATSSICSKDLEIRKQAQESFDRIFAQKLSENYKEGLEDKAAEEKAYKEALAEFNSNSSLPKPK